MKTEAVGAQAQLGKNKWTLLRGSSTRKRGIQQGLCGCGENRLWARTQGKLAGDESVCGRSRNGRLYTAGSGLCTGSGK